MSKTQLFIEILKQIPQYGLHNIIINFVTVTVALLHHFLINRCTGARINQSPG